MTNTYETVCSESKRSGLAELREIECANNIKVYSYICVYITFIKYRLIKIREMKYRSNSALLQSECSVNWKIQNK